jgi:site-specific DNA-methyltransferase (adenine-specific)
MGSGTTAVAAKRCGRNFVGFELNSDYCALIDQRLSEVSVQEHVLAESAGRLAIGSIDHVPD